MIWAEETIKAVVNERELLCQLAEEANELAQAALKLRRALDGTNFTPKSVRDCRENLTEEIADVGVILRMLGLTSDHEIFKQQKIGAAKQIRWAERLLKEETNNAQSR